MAANDAFFAAATVRGLTADDPASDERRLARDNLERVVHARDLEPLLLIESCGFMSLSAPWISLISAFQNHCRVFVES